VVDQLGQAMSTRQDEDLGKEVEMIGGSRVVDAFGLGSGLL